MSLISIEDGVFEVLATAGDTHLGGEDFDNRVMDHFTKLYKRKTGTDVSDNLRALGKLKKGVEKAKRTLSSQQSAKIEIESFEGGNDFLETLTWGDFEELNIDLFRRTMKSVECAQRCRGQEGEYRRGEVLSLSLLPSLIDRLTKIVLVGGSTHIPKIQELLKEYFNGKELSNGINPEEAVAYGAATHAAILSGEDNVHLCSLLMDVYPVSLGIETTGGVFTQIITRNTIMPAMKSKMCVLFFVVAVIADFTFVRQLLDLSRQPNDSPNSNLRMRAPTDKE